MSSPDASSQKGRQEIDPAMMDLFRVELETQAQVLSMGLLEIEKGESHYQDLEPLMRAAHSIKGAARIVDMEPLIHLSHSIEDAFVAGQKNQAVISSTLIEILFKAVDQLSKLSKISKSMMHTWVDGQKASWNSLCEEIKQALENQPFQKNTETYGEAALKTQDKTPLPSLKGPVSNGQLLEEPSRQKPLAETGEQLKEKESKAPLGFKSEDRILRVSAKSLNRLMGLAGEAMVESGWLEPFFKSLMKMKGISSALVEVLDRLQQQKEEKKQSLASHHYLAEAQGLAKQLRSIFLEEMASLEAFIIRNAQLSTHLYAEVINSRMRPFSDGVEGLPRMVRDLAKELKKKVHFEIHGKNTPVDRDILEKLESPLGHLLRNALDHGIGTPEERASVGKPPEGKIILEAQHKGGRLLITVSDDGRGVDLDLVRKSIVEKELVKPEIAKTLSEAELLDFLLLPGFSTSKQVTDISGRGIGLNVVKTMVEDVSGSLHIYQEFGKGLNFSLQLPLTLSVIRALVVEISGDPYAFPLSRIDHVLEMPKAKVESIEGRLYFCHENQNIGLIQASEVLDLQEERLPSEQNISVVIFSDHKNVYGVIVDRLIGQKEFVVHELDARLKKTQDVSSAALLEDGSPIIILDIEDMVRSIDRLISTGVLHARKTSGEASKKAKKKILVVEDSITVREVEARLLSNHGYEVETAVNGVDGWNAVRIGDFDLVITDVDMPRMSGIELVRAIRADPHLKKLPVMIVSYKEREEDKFLGLQAGASYYLAKSSFHDETMLNAVRDLIGD